MTNWRLAKSLVKLREQINALYPSRDKSSDGSIGDTAHSARKSDHNPDQYGIVRAIDIDEDVAAGQDAMPIVSALQASKDPRIKYIIYEGRITVKGDVTKWKPYTGSKNPHRHHFHISVVPDRGLGDDDTPWDLSALGTPVDITVPPAPFPAVQPELKKGSKGEAVKRLQLALRGHGEMIDADSDFGPATEKAVKNFQLAKGLRPDGISGVATNKALGL